MSVIWRWNPWHIRPVVLLISEWISFLLLLLKKNEAQKSCWTRHSTITFCEEISTAMSFRSINRYVQAKMKRGAKRVVHFFFFFFFFLFFLSKRPSVAKIWDVGRVIPDELSFAVMVILTFRFYLVCNARCGYTVLFRMCTFVFLIFIW